MPDDIKDYRDYLNRLRRVDYAIRALERHRTDVIEENARISANLSGVVVQHSPGDPTSRAGMSLADYDALLGDQLKDLTRLRTQALALIDNIRDSRYREVLTNYYVYGLSWPAVATEMNYDLRWVFRLHGRALLAFERVYKTRH